MPLRPCDPEDPFNAVCCPGETGMMIPALYFGTDVSEPSSFYPSAVAYFLLLGWAFSAVAIVSDVFMTSIEVITSAERIIIIDDAITGRKKKYRAKVWNDTVANLTLMALGSSAPEIMLSLIELLNNKLFSGMLGPNTIVGSAAFNFFMISAVCISALPEGELRLIVGTKVYACTCSFSLFAYIWLYIVLGLISPNRVDVPEALITFIFFPVLVGLAYAFDTEKCFRKQRSRENKVVVYSAQAPGAKDNFRNSVMTTKKAETVEKIKAMLSAQAEDGSGGGNMEVDGMSAETIQMVRQQLKAEYGNALDNATEDSMMKLIISNVEQEKSGPKSRAHYRVAATRNALGSKKVKGADEKLLDTVAKIEDAGPESKDVHKQPACEFVTDNYSCLEGCGQMTVRVIRSDDSLSFPSTVKYKTRGTESAQPGKDFVEVEDQLEFGVEEAYKDITITIIDNDIVEEDKVFYIDLSEPRCTTGDSTIILGDYATCTVTIIDDDEPGALDFPQPKFTFIEGVDEEAVLNVVRRKGGSGKIWCDFETEEIDDEDCGEGEEPAEKDKNFELLGDKMEFEHNQSSSSIKIPLVNSGSQDKAYKFRVVLKNPGGDPNPCRFELETTGIPRSKGTMNLDHVTCEVIVTSDPEMKKRNEALLNGIKAEKEDEKISGSDYKEQFVAALYCGGSKEDQAESSWGDMISHLLVLPWKVLFALCPPAEWGGGYPCFLTSLLMIGFVTAFVGDLAAHFGCAVGISDSLTAITVVALGTSLPDTFASKQAAMEDPYADASIGNVTGSNSVNVFLGLGLPWTLGALYWDYYVGKITPEWMERPVSLSGTDTYKIYMEDYPGGGFMVPAGDLGFSVAVYSALAIVAVIAFIIRRKIYGGELGGPKVHCYLSSCFFAMLWIAYIVLSALGPSVFSR
jgi:solute carrier family 8 (sodium/calcium exchanger)